MKNLFLTAALAFAIAGCSDNQQRPTDSAAPETQPSTSRSPILSAGTDTGGGGNTVAGHFVSIGTKALQIILGEYPDLDLNVQETVSGVEVFAVPQNELCFTDLVTGNDKCFEAYFNSDDDEIKFSLDAWANKNCREKLLLTSHEYLRSVGLEDANYIYSSIFMETTTVSDKTLLKIVGACGDINYMTEN